MNQSDQHSHDTGYNMLGDIFVEPTDTQANIKRVICSTNQSRDVTPAVNKSNVFDKVKIGRETESLMAKVFANDKVITGLIDSGAQMSILSRRCLPADNDFVQSGQILLRGPFGEEVLAQLINLPCKLLVNDKSSEMPDILITVAVTDELKGNEMLISLDDYATLLEHSETCIPRVKVVNNSTLIVDEDVSHVDNEVIAMNRDINSMPDVIDTLNVSEDCDINSSNVLREYNNSGCVSSNSDSIDVTDVVVHDDTSDTSVTGVNNYRNRDELIESQKCDVTLDKIRSECSKQNSSYFKREGIIFRNNKMNDQSVEQLVVPMNRRHDIVERAHDSIFGGHFASRKTLQKINQLFCWPGMKKQVKTYVDSCIECQRKRRVTTNDRIPIKAIARPETAFEHIHIDVIGPIEPSSSKGHKYVLCIIDVHSRWAECFPLKTLTAKETCDRLMEMFMHVWLPITLVSDNATNMVSGLNQELYKRLGIELRVTTPFHPSGNGIIERFNATIKKMIHHVIISDKPRSWSEKLPYMLWAYREVPHSTTGLSPYQLVYGKVARGPLGVLRDVWTDNIDQRPCSNRTATEYLENLKSNLEIAREFARDYADKAQSTYVENHNKHSQCKSFEVGDQVIVLMPNSTNSLLSEWIGPATIVLKVSDNSYNVLCDNGSVRTLHADKLRFFNSRIANVGIIFDDDDDYEFGNIVTYLNDACNVNNQVSTDDLNDWKRFEEIGLNHLNTEEQQQLRSLLFKHRKVFNDKPGYCDILTHQIKLKDGFQPKAFQPYRIPDKIKSEVDKQIDQLLKDGKIRPSNSLFAHPIVYVAKKDSPDIRLCVDYKYINS